MSWEHGPSNPDPDAYREPEPDAPPDDGKRVRALVAVGEYGAQFPEVEKFLASERKGEK